MKEPMMNYRPRQWVDRQGRPDPLVWHEAAHALVAHRVGMRVEFVDMTGLMVPSPVCGMDVETVPAARRAEATGLAALAGPVAEAMENGQAPLWRQDGKVAQDAAKALAKDQPGQMKLMMKWVRQVRAMLENDRAFKPLVYLLAKREMLTGEEVVKLVQMVDGRGKAPQVPASDKPQNLLLTTQTNGFTVRTPKQGDMNDRRNEIC